MKKLITTIIKNIELILPIRQYENIIGSILKERHKTLATTESCTGGLVSSLLTDVSGSSEYIFANFVTYSNEAKMKYLNVKEETLKTYGAVSEQTAKEMVAGLLNVTNSDYALATTGIAGPTGGSKEKPIGLMYLGLASKNEIIVKKILQPEFLDRKTIKKIFAKEALKELYLFIK